MPRNPGHAGFLVILTLTMSLQAAAQERRASPVQETGLVDSAESVPDLQFICARAVMGAAVGFGK